MSSILFSDLGLSKPLLSVLEKMGYDAPTKIQAAAIPRLMQGVDIIGQAQTGTGKTGAFALPLLEQIKDTEARLPQVLVLAPTRELAIQVAESFEAYAANLPSINIVTLCGGMEYRTQIRALKQGVRVVVGTPGRVIDHLNRGTLNLSELSALVLDEADEMLRMGFIDDVEQVLSSLPATAQRALFSATMPKPIRKLAQTYLRDPDEVTIETKTATAATIRQRYLFVHRDDKKEALLRLLDTEEYDGIIIFTRTKESTLELADFLIRAGYRAAALNGDMDQKARELVVEQIKNKRINLLVGTDVVARGLDVPRISHVINYDMPFDAQTYVHRIGRTGRAGREGDAIMFVSAKDKRLLHNIEKVTRQSVEEMPWPTAEQVNRLRKERFLAAVVGKSQGKNLQPFLDILTELQADQQVNMLEVAAALAAMNQGEKPFYVSDAPRARQKEREPRNKRERSDSAPRERRSRAERLEMEEGMARYRIEVGKQHNAKPSNIVGAIANEIGISSQQIGRISLFANFSTVDLPDTLTKKQLNHLKTVWVAGRQLDLEPDTGAGGNSKKASKAKPKTQAKPPKAPKSRKKKAN